ncbi:YrzI family small protein [Bacillus sp. FJAT-27251]
MMTLNILFFTITIKKREISLEEARHNEMVEKLLEENRDRQAQYMRQF